MSEMGSKTYTVSELHAKKHPALQLPRVKLLPAEWLLKAAGNPRDKNMSDWLHNLPVGAMALIVFGVTYLVATVIYALVMALAVGERARGSLQNFGRDRPIANHHAEDSAHISRQKQSPLVIIA